MAFFILIENLILLKLNANTDIFRKPIYIFKCKYEIKKIINYNFAYPMYNWRNLFLVLFQIRI